MLFSVLYQEQFQNLSDHYSDPEEPKPEALRRLLQLEAAAIASIEANPRSGLEHPANYRSLRYPGFLWHVQPPARRKASRYWFAYALMHGEPVLAAIFWEPNLPLAETSGLQWVRLR